LWTRGENIGFLVVLGLLVSAWIVTTRGLVFIGNVAAVPLSVISGNFGHPESVAYLKSFEETPGGRFVYALALQKANRLEEASERYSEIESSRAKNNLGVIRHQQGRSDEAKALFEEALEKDAELAEAAFNLGRPASSSRIDRARKFGLEGPIYAMPSRDQWAQAMTGSFSRIFASLPFTTAHQLGGMPAGTPVARGSVSTPVWLAVAFLALLGFLAILGLIFRLDAGPKSPRPKRNLVAWFLGFLLPGTARQYSLLGPPLFVLTFFSLLVFMVMDRSGGMAANILDAIAMPSYEQIYGIWGIVRTPLEETVLKMNHLWWIIFALNPVVLVCLEYLFPDPWGPRGKKDPQ